MDVRMPRCSRLSRVILKLAVASFCIYCCLTYIWHTFKGPILRKSFSDTIRIDDKVIWNNTILGEVRNSIHHDSDNVAHPSLSGRSIPWISHPQIPRRINKIEYESTRRLLQYIDEVFTVNNITHVLAYGTLLGSYISHDILPWDDDVDLLVRLSDKQKILDLLAIGSKYHHIKAKVNAYYKLTYLIKIYKTRSTRAGKYPWNWPYADVAFFEENDTSVWATESGQLKVNRSSFYLIYRWPFSGLWLPSPKDPRLLLQMKYKQFKCEPENYDEHTIISYWTNFYPSYIPTANCRSVVGYYPVVHRNVHNRGVNETLKIGELDIYTVYVDEPQTGKSAQLFDLT